MWSIAREFGVDKHQPTPEAYTEIMRLNGLKDAAIWPGERLIVPVN